MTTLATADDVERTSRDTTIAQWGVASVVMVGSAAAAGFTFHYLGENWGLGVITALAVDLALATWLRIGRRLRAVDATAISGLILEVAALCMTLFLNVGAAVFRGINQNSDTARELLGVAHSFLPIILFLISLAGGEAQHKLGQLRRAHAAEEQADRDAETRRVQVEALSQQRQREDQESRRSRGELVTAEDYARSARDLKKQADELKRQAEQEIRSAEQERVTAAQIRTDTEAELAATKTAEDDLHRARQKRDKPTGPTPGVSREERREWVRQQISLGRSPTGADVNNRFGPPRTGAAVVAEVAKERAAKPSLHAVGAQS